MQRPVRWIGLIAVFGLLAGPVAHAQTMQPRLVIQAGHAGDVSGLAFSPDDKLLASAGADRTVKIWDVASLRELRTLPGHSEFVTALAFTRDGSRIVSADRQGDILVRDVASGEARASFACGDVDPGKSFGTNAFSLSPDGSLIAAACSDRIELVLGDSRGYVRKNVVAVWELATGKLLRVLAGHTDTITSVSFAADSRRVLSSGADGTVRLWNALDGAQLLRVGPRQGRVTAAALSPDQRWIASAGRSAIVQVWDAATGREVLALPDAGTDVTGLGFTSGGSVLFAADASGVVRTWNVPGGQLLGRTSGRKERVEVVALAHDNTTLAVSYHGGLWLGRLDAADSPGREFHRQARIITGLALSAEGSTLAAANGAGGNITLWSVPEGRPAKVLETRVNTNLENSGGVAFSPANGDLAALSELARSDVDRQRRWEVKLWQSTGFSSLPAHRVPAFARVLAYSPDGGLIAVGGEQLSIVAAAGGSPARVLADAPPHSAYVSLAFTPDGARLVAVNTETGIEEWDVRTGNRRRILDEAATSCATMAGLFVGGRLLASGNCEGEIRLWDFEAGKVLLTMDGDEGPVGAGSAGPVEAIAFSSPGSELLASAHANHVIRLWDLANPRLVRELVGHTSAVKGVVFSPDARILFSAGLDGTARVWRVADGALLATLVAFADGRWAVTDPSGRFDVADLEDMPHMHWVMPDDPLTPVPLEAFMRDYYEPRLLARILAGESFSPARPLTDLNRVQPQVKVTAVAPDPTDPAVVRVTVTARGATRNYLRQGQAVPVRTAAHDLRLFRDGQLVGHADGRLASHEGGPFSRTFPVRLPLAKAGQDVVFSAYAFNDDRVKSATSRAVYRTPAVPARAAAGKGTAYVITMGVNTHDNPAWNLGFAANDARLVRQVLSTQLMKTDRFAAVRSISLVSDGPVRQASKAALRGVLARLAGGPADSQSQAVLRDVEGAGELKAATPDDLVLLAFAGHGFADDAGRFFLMTQDTGAGSGKAVTAELKASSISSEELSLWLRDVDAGDISMIVDACQSAASVQGEGFKPGPMGSRGLGQLSFDKGMRILAASQSDEFALEDNRLQHGLLTFSLIKDGLEAFDADHEPRDKTILLDEWLRYGVRRVPVLAEEAKRGALLVNKPGTQRGAVIVKGPSGTPAQRTPPAQQPALFDFAKQRRALALDVRTP